jgi:hypothetical protein
MRIGGEKRLTFPGRENDVIVEVRVGVRHGLIVRQAGDCGSNVYLSWSQGLSEGNSEALALHE